MPSSLIRATTIDAWDGSFQPGSPASDETLSAGTGISAAGREFGEPRSERWPRSGEERAEHRGRQEHQAGCELNLALAQLKLIRLFSESWRRCCLSLLIWAVASPSSITATNKLMTKITMVGQLNLRIKSSKQTQRPDLARRVQGGSLWADSATKWRHHL